MAGESYTFICNVSGLSVTTYQWRKDSTVFSQTGQTLSFSHLRLSDAERYTCNVSENSVIQSNGQDVTIEGIQMYRENTVMHLCML